MVFNRFFDRSRTVFDRLGRWSRVMFNRFCYRSRRVMLDRFCNRRSMMFHRLHRGDVDRRMRYRMIDWARRSDRSMRQRDDFGSRGSNRLNSLLLRLE